MYGSVTLEVCVVQEDYWNRHECNLEVCHAASRTSLLHCWVVGVTAKVYPPRDNLPRVCFRMSYKQYGRIYPRYVPVLKS